MLKQIRSKLFLGSVSEGVQPGGVYGWRQNTGRIMYHADWRIFFTYFLVDLGLLENVGIIFVWLPLLYLIKG